ncbi:sigma-70 family RNA polymerase sigma factor [Microbacterium nymphoidis]|uniref:sigma-70 family RNA polymerase sigma factor n=1 Tax=Microbacterium nymphoidis TaxID=2898586 RepID=UPI001E5401C6|nr:sigma-70 family RNA polymerase sigma factor [Microbacterium nymphoidis]MCD2498456.1 sigma-70 family RNA polymerase sigma factor [Microbacterium nymphoidis]
MNDDPFGLEASDDDLLRQVRAGDSTAFGELWRRHAGVAMSVARSFSTLSAEDIVSESFERLLTALRQGKGPRGEFRAYLIATVRNTGRQHYNRHIARAEYSYSEIQDAADPTAATTEQVMITMEENNAAAQAFATLPPRWQGVLWYSHVDGVPPREIATRLGLTANGVSALVVRAKRAFRDAWLSAQLTRASSEECRATIRSLGAYTRNGLSTRARVKVEAHLADCDQCTHALAEARLVARNLALVLLPAVAGVAGASHYLSTMSPPPVPEHLASQLPATPTQGDIRGPQPTPASRRASLAVAALVIAGAGGMIAISALVQNSADRPDAASAATDSTSPAPPPAESTETPQSRTPTASPVPAPSKSEARTEDEQPPGTMPTTNPTSAPVPPTTPPTMTPTPVSPPAEQPATIEAPDAEIEQSDPRLYPWLSGTSSYPGAKITVIDTHGKAIAQTTVDAFGDWSVHLSSSSPGDHSAAVFQTVGTAVSAPTPRLEYSLAAPPIPDTPRDHSVVNGTSFRFQMSENPDTIIQRKTSATHVIQTLTVPASGLWNEYFTLPPGHQSIQLRYADASGRNFGPWSSTTLDVEK